MIGRISERMHYNADFEFSINIFNNRDGLFMSVETNLFISGETNVQEIHINKRHCYAIFVKHVSVC